VSICPWLHFQELNTCPLRLIDRSWRLSECFCFDCNRGGGVGFWEPPEAFPPRKKIKQIQRFFAGLGNPPEKVHVVSNKCHSRKLLKWPLPRMTTFSLSNSNRAKQDASWIVHLTILWEELTSFLWGGTIQCPWLCWCSHYDIHSLKTRDLVTKPQKLQTLPCWIVSHPNS
jgi:hypothetical protein